MADTALIAEADRAAASGNLAAARSLLKRAAADAPGDVQLLLKLAALTKAAGQPREALDAVHQALVHAPLDFIGLVLRATLLESLGDSETDQAWSNALSQRPPGDLPPALAAAVAKGEARTRLWTDQRERQMVLGMEAAMATATDEERARLDRFRSNVLRRTRHYHSEPTHFHYPGLAEREFHPRRLFPWLASVEAATADLANELAGVMRAERAELVPYIQYAEHQPLDQWRALNQSRDWTAIHLLQNGSRVEANARHCPRAMALLAQLPQPNIAGAGPNAMFSLLALNTAIPPHVGVNNTRLVCHLPLIVPAGCWFRVGAETRQWRRGEAFVFDDTIEHEAMNPSDELRVVFIFDVWHPDLSAVERDAVKDLIEGDSATGGTPL